MELYQFLKTNSVAQFYIFISLFSILTNNQVKESNLIILFFIDTKRQSEIIAWNIVLKKEQWLVVGISTFQLPDSFLEMKLNTQK